MKNFLSALVCCYVLSVSAQTTTPLNLADYAGHGYTSSLGFESVALRIAQLHTWRQLQLMMRQVAYANSILLVLGWPGRTDMGDNTTLRFVAQVGASGKPSIDTLKKNPNGYWDKVKNFNPEEISFSHQWQPMVKGQIGGVCVQTNKKDCFEPLKLQTDDPFVNKPAGSDEITEIDALSVFNDFYGSGGRFDETLYQFTNSLKRFDNTKLDINKNSTYEPMTPDSRFFNSTVAEGGKGIGEQQQHIAKTLQLKSFGEKDTVIDDIDKQRLINNFAFSSQGLSSVLQTVMESNMRKFQPRLMINLINQAECIRELIQLSSHMALYQQNLIDMMVINQAFGSLNLYAVEFAPTGGNEFNLPARNSAEQNKLDEEGNALQNFQNTLTTTGDAFFQSPLSTGGS